MNRRGAAVAVLLLSSVVVTGCTDASDADFCPQYEELSARVVDLRETPPVATNTEEIQAQVEAFQAALDQLEDVSDGRFEQTISDLRTAANDLAESAVATGQEAADKAEEAMHDSLETVRTAWAVLEQVAQNQCT